MTDPDSRLYRKSNGKEAKLSFPGHIVVENRNGLIAAALTTQADGMAEKEAGILMAQEIAERVGHRITMSADRGYDIAEFVDTMRELNCTPHVMQNTTNRRSAIDGRTTRHEGSHQPAETLAGRETFGWLKTMGPLRKVKLRGLPKVSWLFVFSCAACNLWRLPKLMRAECVA